MDNDQEVNNVIDEDKDDVVYETNDEKKVIVIYEDTSFDIDQDDVRDDDNVSYKGIDLDL